MLVFPPITESVASALVPVWGERRYAIDTHPIATGLGSLSGTVTVSAVPAARRVEVYDNATMVLVASTLSAADGTWSISGLTTTRLLLVVVRGDSGESTVTRAVYAT